jgi:hypothetical protein
MSLAVDTAGNLYVARKSLGGNGVCYDIAPRNMQGKWSGISAEDSAHGQVSIGDSATLAVDAAGKGRAPVMKTGVAIGGETERNRAWRSRYDRP